MGMNARSRIRYGMAGGGEGAFIGAVHRMAAAIDGEYALVCGAFSSDADRNRRSAEALGLDSARTYPTLEALLAAEAALPEDERMEALAIVTPNHLHAPMAIAALDAGFHVFSEKPVALNLDEALAIDAAVARSGKLYGLTFTYSGYPLVEEARVRVARGDLGAIRLVQVEYSQGWLSQPIDRDGQKQAEWRTDPARAGRSACLADIGVHAFSLAHFVSGMAPCEVAADLTTFVPGRRLDDNAHVLMRYASGARGVLVASQVSPGNYNRLSVKIYGDKAGLEWYAHEPEYLHFCEFGKPHVILTRGGAGVGGEAARVSRMPAEHPEGYVEGFGNLYRDAIALISARRRGELMDSGLAALVPSVEDGLLGMRFIEASVDSNEAGGVWTPVATQL